LDWLVLSLVNCVTANQKFLGRKFHHPPDMVISARDLVDDNGCLEALADAGDGFDEE
jgi:hypothetical protein